MRGHNGLVVKAFIHPKSTILSRYMGLCLCHREVCLNNTFREKDYHLLTNIGSCLPHCEVCLTCISSEKVYQLLTNISSCLPHCEVCSTYTSSEKAYRLLTNISSCLPYCEVSLTYISSGKVYHLPTNIGSCLLHSHWGVFDLHLKWESLPITFYQLQNSIVNIPPHYQVPPVIFDDSGSSLL